MSVRYIQTSNFVSVFANTQCVYREIGEEMLSRIFCLGMGTVWGRALLGNAPPLVQELPIDPAASHYGGTSVLHQIALPLAQRLGAELLSFE